jgi:putative intracellular protease/amidase
MRLSILLFDGFTALDVVGGYEVLANLQCVQTEFMAQRTGAVFADTRRLALHAYRTFEEVTHTDMLYVPGGPGVEKGLHDPALLDTIRRLHATSTWTVGICNGVELLGAAGVIDGLEVTTNWFARDRVAAYGARVSNKRYLRDGKVVSGAGVSASIDAGLYLAGLIAGEDTAKTIQLGIEYYPDPPFGNGTPDTAPARAQAVIRAFERNNLQRLESLNPAF